MLKLIRGEPALVMSLVTAALGLLLAAGVHLRPGAAGAVEAAVSAGLGLAVAAATRPFRVAALTSAVTALGTLLVTFGVPHVTAGMVSAVNTFAVAVVMIAVRGHVSPRPAGRGPQVTVSPGRAGVP